MNYSDLIKKYGFDKWRHYYFPGRTYCRSILLDSAQKYIDAQTELGNLGDGLEFDDLEKVRSLLYTIDNTREIFLWQTSLESIITRRYNPYERLKLEIEINNQINQSIKGTVDF